jgi:competence protein ComGF
MAKLTHKIKSSTLIEALVAMVIIILVYAIGLTIFINVNKSNNNRLKIEAFLVLEDIVTNTKKEAKYIDEIYDLENLKIEKKITKYENNNSLNILQIKVLSKDNKLLAEHREIVKINLLNE